MLQDAFGVSGLTASETIAFLNQAHAHGKPVMVGEATPRYIGADDAGDWDTWFGPFFNLINDNPVIKAHTYINWDWANTNLPDWGDARLETGNATVRNNYIAELSSPLYEHAGAGIPSWVANPATCDVTKLLGIEMMKTDLNGDCKVDIEDMVILASSWLFDIDI